MLSDYMKQSLTLETAGTPNEYNEITYTSSTIKGRKETGNKLVRNAKGEEVVSSAVVYTASAVNNKDKIDGELVVFAKPEVDLDGRIMFYKVYLI